MGGGFVWARQLGIDDIVVGIWVGGFILAISMWLSKKATLRGIKNKWIFLAIGAFPVAIVFSMLLFIPGLFEFGNKLFGMERLWLGIIIGSVVFWLSKFTDKVLLKSNKGIQLFPIQNIILSVSFILLVSLFLHFVFFTR
jgi:uncharacterized membrane protein (UPF0136 family)